MYDSVPNYKGVVRYQHVRNVAVSVDDWVYNGTHLADCHPHIDNEPCYVNNYSAHVHLRPLAGSWSWPSAMCDDNQSVTQNSTVIVTFN